METKTTIKETESLFVNHCCKKSDPYHPVTMDTEGKASATGYSGTHGIRTGKISDPNNL